MSTSVCPLLMLRPLPMLTSMSKELRTKIYLNSRQPIRRKSLQHGRYVEGRMEGIENDLTIRTTFASMLADTGRQGTHVPLGADTWCRNDYVLVSASVLVYHDSVASWQDVDIGHKRKDHYPAAARIMLSTRSSACPARRRRPCYDRTAVADKVKVKEFCDTVRAFHRIPFEIEPTTHCHLLTTWMREALVACFGRPRPSARQPHVSDATMSLIGQKRRLARRARRAGMCLKCA